MIYADTGREFWRASTFPQVFRHDRRCWVPAPNLHLCLPTNRIRRDHCSPHRSLFAATLVKLGFERHIFQATAVDETRPRSRR